MHLDLVWELYYTKNNRVRSESFVMPVEDSGDVGVGHVVTFSVLSGSISTPAAETICPTNFTFRLKNEHEVWISPSGNL
jgi:hypothetical protein